MNRIRNLIWSLQIFYFSTSEKTKHTELIRQLTHKAEITSHPLATECLQNDTRHGGNFHIFSALPPQESALHQKSVVHHL